jgi:hypothetical protein
VPAPCRAPGPRGGDPPDVKMWPIGGTFKRMTPLTALSLVRRGLLALLALGSLGILTELVLLEHYDERVQWVPLVLLVLTLATIVWHWVEGGRTSLRALQVLMLLLVVAGLVGMALHLKENVAAEEELNPGTGGLDFWWAVIRGDLPTLAPGTLVQFGLLGLLYAYRHPALGGGEE